MRVVSCFLLFYWIGYVESGYYFVTAPNVLRYNHDEKVLLSVFDETNFDIEIWLQLTEGSEPFSDDKKRVTNEMNAVTTTIKVTEKDLFKDDESKKNPPKFVYLYAKTNYGTKKRKLLLDYNSGYIVLQTSKPVYHPKENVQIRALAMTESLQYAKGWNITMDIISPSDLTYGRITKTDDEHVFFEDSFQLPPHAELGLWTIKAFYRGQFNTEARTTFRIMEYVLPTFGVTVDVKEKIIMEDTEEVTIKVEANYVYHKAVKGRVALTISCQTEDGRRTEYPETIYEQLTEGKAAIVFDINKLTGVVGGFPDGQTLNITANVIEQVTGNIESAVYTNTLFSRKKYKFDFTRSKMTFRPGLSYSLKVQLSLANGQSPGITKLKATELSGELDNGVKIEDTDQNGYSRFIFSIASTFQKPLSFRIEAGKEKSQHFQVQPFKGGDQMVVEQHEGDNDMIMEATTTIKGEEATRVLMMIISRGQYMHHSVLVPAINPQRPIGNAVQEKISPEARLLGFYVVKNSNKIVADSSKFSLTPKCQGKGLKLESTDGQNPTTHIPPNSHGTLKVTGSPRMVVGLNAMDQALLLLDNQHVLRKNQMVDIMKSHDLGCGEGGGTTTEQVFRDAGMTVLTNANVNEGALERTSLTCQGHSRKKRAASCESTCCQMGEKYADKVLLDDLLYMYEKDYEQKDPYTACYSRTMQLAAKKDKRDKKLFFYTHQCLVEHFIKCFEKINSKRNDNQVEGKSAWEDTDDYVKALEAYGIKDVFVRSDFKDSWLFQTIELDQEGKGETPIIMPHSITTWMFQGIGITESEGFCIAEPENVTSILPFFLQVDLPYTAKRLEYFEIDATVFNNKNQDADITLFIEGLNGLCTGADPGEIKKVTEEFVLRKNDAHSVRIPILAHKAGRYEIEITAIGKMGPITGLSDAVRKELIVVNEGVEKRETVTVCLNPLTKETDTDCTSSDRIVNTRVTEGVQTVTVDLSLPDGVYKDTGSAYGRLSSNVMDDVVTTVVSGLDGLLNKPNHCGEQTMIYLAPIVYVMDYWKQTKKMTKARETKGNDWIRYGGGESNPGNYSLNKLELRGFDSPPKISYPYNQIMQIIISDKECMELQIKGGVARELTFQKLDGSYGAWLHRGSSTWLTAFVAKVYCQAKRVTDNAVKKVEYITKPIDWLTEQTNPADGSFFDPLPVIHREMIGQIKEKDPSLTAFALITFLECDIRTAKTDSTINRAVKYLTSLPDQKYKGDTYLLAITTYAMAMNRHGRRWRYKNMLMNKAVKDKNKNFLYWGPRGQNPADRNAVETTAYALLALLKFNDIDNAGKIVRWLTNQRNAIGSWRSTQDTVVALQALSAYSIATKSPNADLNVKLSANNWVGATNKLTNENSELLGLIRDIPVGPGKNLITVNVDGEGSGRLVIDLRYNRPQNDDEKCSFTVSSIQIKDVKGVDQQIPGNFDRECDVCGYCQKESGKNDHVELGEGDLPAPAEIKPKAGIQKRAADQPPQNAGKQHCITFDIASNNNREHGMSIVDVGLETGMTVVTQDLDKLKFDGVIDNYEVPETGKGFVVLYVDKITSEPKKFKFRLQETAEIDLETRQPVAIKIFDYYSPEYECIKFYGTGEKKGSPVAYQCTEGAGGQKGRCSCLADVCPEATKVNKENLVTEGKAGEKPAQKLSLFTCDRKKAGMAIIMKVDQIVPDFETQAFTAVVTVVKQIHQGNENLEEGKKIELFWRMNCQDIKIMPGEQYYLITKDDGGQMTRSKSGRLMFLLSGKTIIVEEHDWARNMKRADVRKLSKEKKKQRYVQLIMNAYEKLMKEGCLQ